MAAAGLKPECEVKKDKEQGPTYHNSTPQLVKEDFCCVRIKFI